MTDAHVQVVRGVPDDVELAALVAGLLAAGSDEGQPTGGPAPTAAWSDRRRAVRPGADLRPGPDTWRWSLRG